MMRRLLPLNAQWYSGDGPASSSVASSSPYHCQMNEPIGVRACDIKSVDWEENVHTGTCLDICLDFFSKCVFLGQCSRGGGSRSDQAQGSKEDG